MIKVKVGDLFTAIISNRVSEGKIQIENGVVYLCQNNIIGSSCDDKLGYDYSWCICNANSFSERNLQRADVYDFQLKSNRKSRIANLHIDDDEPIIASTEKVGVYVKVVRIGQDVIEFEGGVRLYSQHEQDCCESHYLSTSDLTIKDFEGLEFDLSEETFFKRIDGYGIELVPVKGWPVKIPGYGSNNGYYSSNLNLVLVGTDFEKSYDISECQDIDWN